MKKNTAERALTAETVTRTEKKKKKEMGKLDWFMSDINRNIPTT